MPLPAVFCGCICTVVMLGLRRSRGLLVLLRFLGIHTLAGWIPISHPFVCPQSTSGSASECCRGCPAVCPVWVFYFSNGNKANSLVSESAFQSLLPSGSRGKDLVSTTARAIISADAQHGAACVLAKGSLNGAGGARHPRSLLVFAEMQRICLFKLCVRAFSKRGSRFKLKPWISGAEEKRGTACNGTGTRKPVWAGLSSVLWVLHSCIWTAVHKCFFLSIPFLSV